MSKVSETFDSGVEEAKITMVYKGYSITVCSQRDIWGIGGKMLYSSVIRLSDMRVQRVKSRLYAHGENVGNGG